MSHVLFLVGGPDVAGRYGLDIVRGTPELHVTPDGKIDQGDSRHQLPLSSGDHRRKLIPKTNTEMTVRMAPQIGSVLVNRGPAWP